MRSLVLALLSLSLTGCGQIEALFLSPGEKINRAFPPSAQVRATAEDLQSLAGTDTPAGNELAAHYAARLELRGLTCAQGQMITRLSTVEAIREQPASRDCLNTQDAALLEFLQIRQVGWRLGLPALRPLKPLGEPQISSPGLPIFSGIAASSAGVAVVLGTRGELLTLQIPSGETIAKLPGRQEAGLHDARLSPNGRVLALASGYSSRVHEFIDSETGAVLWKTERLNSFLAWLPGLSAGLADDREGELTVIDFRTGEARHETSDLRRQTWATPLTASSSRIAIGNIRDIRLIDYQRTPAGVKGEIVKHFKLSRGGVTSGKNPTSMQGGKSLFLFGMNGLMTVDLESEQENHWKTDSLISNDYAKLSESSVLVDVYDSPMKRAPWVLNIADGTIAPVSTEAGSDGILYELEGRTGFLRREHDGIWFGDKLKQGEPQPFNDFLDARNLEQQLAKLNSMTRANAAANAAPSSAPIHLDLSPARPMASQETRITANPPALPSGQFALQTKGARVEAIGVYESSKRLPQGPGNQPGEISVDIPPSSEPRVLVLSSYESVRWKLNQLPGSQIKLILIASYYPSFVEGAGSIQVVPITASYAYERDSREYAQLTTEVQRLTLRAITNFQGGYAKDHFVLGSQ